jgi:hypothetical protein
MGRGLDSIYSWARDCVVRPRLEVTSRAVTIASLTLGDSEFWLQEQFAGVRSWGNAYVDCPRGAFAKLSDWLRVG